jgi:putative tricarboxylic transport membrane protein
MPPQPERSEGTSMKFNNRVLGLIVLAGGAALSVSAWRMPPTPSSTIGPGFFPLLIGLVLLSAGFLLIAGSRVGPQTAAITVPDWFSDTWGLLNVSTVASCIVLYVVGVERLGFVPTASLIVFALAARLGQSVLRAAPTAVIAALCFHMLFAKLLRVPLPPGLLKGFL